MSLKNIYFTLIILLIIIIFFYIYHPQIINESFSNNDLKVYFINLNENIDRWEKIKNTLPNLVRFNAINGKNINAGELIKNGFLTKKNTLRPGQLGCALSHIQVMNLIKNQKEEYALILEDDVIIPKNFQEIFNSLKQFFPQKWDVIFLGGCNIHGKKYNEKFIIPTNNSGSKNLCMHAVLLNKNNVDKILKILKPLYRPIDSQLRDSYSKLNVFYTYPNIINQNKKLVSNRRVIDGLPQSKYWQNHHLDVKIEK